MGKHSDALAALAHGPTDKKQAVKDGRDAAAIEAKWGFKAAPVSKVEVPKTDLPIAPKQGVQLNESPDVYASALLNKPVPAEWERRLREISPKSDQHSWLLLTWMQKPGMPDTGRWVLYECVPAPLVPPEMRERLGGTPYWLMPKDRRAGRETLVSPTQWVIWRKHRVWARPFWIIQGNTGGTPMAYSEQEARWLRLTKQPSQPPHLGALPYAPFDERVVRAIEERDRLRKVGFSLERMRDTADAASLRIEEEMLEREYRKKFLGWYAAQLSEQADFLEWYTRRTEADYTLRRQTQAEFVAANELEERYIETGVVPVHSVR